MKGEDESTTPCAAGFEECGEPPHNAPASSSAQKTKKLSTINLALGVFLLLNVIVLYILHFADRDNDSRSSTAASQKVSSDQLNLAGNAAGDGKAVSLSSAGQITVGAGTTAYLSAAKLPNAALKWVDLLPMDPTSQDAQKTNIMTYSYIDGKSINSFVTTVTVNADKTVDVPAGTAVSSGYQIKRGATLSSSLAVFLLVQNSDPMKITTSIALGKISGDKVTIDEENMLKDAVKDSGSTYVSRLSDTSFALSFYEGYKAGGKWTQYTQVGTIDGNTITLSKAVSFAPDNDDNVTTTINPPQAVTPDGTRFVVPWYVTNSSQGLCLEVFDVVSGSVNDTGKPVCDGSYRPTYFVQSTMLTQDTFALAFYNEANNYAMTIAMAQLGAYSKMPMFHGSYVVENTRGAFDFGNAYEFYPNPSLNVLSGQRLAVSFMNPSNTGKPSVAVLGFANDLSLKVMTPAMPVAPSSFQVANVDSTKGTGAIYLDSVVTPNGLLISYSGQWSNKVICDVPLVESFNPPVGVMTSSQKVAYSGVADVDDLKPGNSYFASTSGNLFGVPGSPSGGFIYANNNTVISSTAFVGIAVDKDKLAISGL